MWVGGILPLRPAVMTMSFAERKFGMLSRGKFFRLTMASLGINAQAELNPIVTRRVWAAAYKLSAPLLVGVFGAA
eukprot:8231308-Pyramimonas_sp.AAC.1